LAGALGGFGGELLGGVWSLLAFGLLQIVWFFWLGIVMVRTRPDAAA
jgi:hypothetical protein